MCQFDTLYYQPEEGFLIRCLQCGRLQLGFGNMAIHFTRDALGEFQQQIARMSLLQPFVSGPDRIRKSILLPTPHDAISLLLSPDDLVRLSFILEHADNEMRALDLLQLFNPVT